MLKTIIISFLSELDQVENKKITIRQTQFLRRLMSHEKKLPNSSVSKAFQEAEEELDTVEQFEYNPEAFYAAP